MVGFIAHQIGKGIVVLLQFLIESSDRHFPDDVIGICLVTAIDDVAFLFVGQDSRSGGGTVNAISIYICIVEFIQCLLDLAHVRSHSAWNNVRRV